MRKQKLNRYIFSLSFIWIAISAYAQKVDSLTHYLEVAGRNNPAVKSDFIAYKASLQKVPQAGAFDDPQLDIGFYLEPMDVLGGRQYADFTLMQMFPWFGTRKAARSEAEYTAKAAFEKFRDTRDNLYLDVYSQWFLLNELQQQLNNNQENRKLLTKLEDLAVRKQATSATSAMSDVLRIQLEGLEIDDNIARIESEIVAEKAKFNGLLNRSGNTQVHLPETFEQLSFIFDEEITMDKIIAQNPILASIEQESLAYKSKSEMNKRKSYPMFGIGIQYMLIGKSKTTPMDKSMQDMDGKDMIMPMISLTLPIFRKKYRAEQEEGKLWWESSQEKYTNTLNTLETELYAIQHELNDASRKIELYKKQSKLAETTYNLLVSEFISGKKDLTNVIQIQRQLLDYKLKTSEATATYNTKIASLQKLISFKDLEH